MLPVLRDTYGNPSSLHWFGQQARAAVERARGQVATLLGASPSEIVFTGSGTEADNLALRGVAAATREPRRRILYAAIEHHAVVNTAKALAEEGHPVEVLTVDARGALELEALGKQLGPHTALVAVMLANNETGVIQPLAEVVRLAHTAGALVFCDAVQAAGKLPLDVKTADIDLLSISAHKIYGPKGAGALYIRGRTPFLPQTLGGSQERNRRAGTENVAGAVGLATALRLACDELDVRNTRLIAMRDRLLDEVPRRVPGTIITGPLDRSRRLPNSASFAFEHVEGEAVLLALDLDGIAASSGSACTTASLEPSHVLVAMGVPEAYLRGSLRLTLGKENTMGDVDRLLDVLPAAVARIRALAPQAARSSTGAPP